MLVSPSSGDGDASAAAILLTPIALGAAIGGVIGVGKSSDRWLEVPLHDSKARVSLGFAPARGRGVKAQVSIGF